MLIRYTTIQSELSALLGFRGSYDPEEDKILDGNLLTSSSGYYFEDFHPLVTIDNIRSIAPDFSDFTYPAHDPNEAYSVGDIVTDKGLYYRAIQPIPESSNILVSDDSYWTQVEPFDLWLQDRIDKSIFNLIDTWFRKKLERDSVKQMLSKRETVKIYGDESVEVDNKSGRIVGVKIVPLRRGVKIRVRRLGFMTNKITSQFIFFLKDEFGNTVTTALISQTLGNGGLTWADLSDLPTWILDPGRTYSVVYDQDELVTQGVKAINGMQYSNGYKAFQTTKYYDTYGVEDGDVVYNNFGIVLDLEVYCDYTDFIVEQKNSFARALGYQFAVDMLQMLVYNPNARINRNNRNADYNRNEIRYELDGDSTSMKKSGLKYLLDKEIELVSFDQDAIDSDCLSCRKKGIRYTTM